MLQFHCRALVASVVVAGACTVTIDSAVPPPPDAQPPSAMPLLAFKNSFYTFAVAACAGCHSEKPNNGVLVPQNPLFACGNVEYAYTAAKPFVDFATPSNSLLVQYAGNNHCGVPSVCGSNSGAVLSEITTWIASDMPLPAAAPRSPVSDLQALQLIDADIRVQPGTSQSYLRYFTIEALGNTNGRPPLVSADVQRSALVKMLNLTSTGPQIVQPTPIDPDRLIYRVDMRQLGWDSPSWQNLKATDPYLQPASFPIALWGAAQQTVRADWFVYSIPNSAVDAYYKFLHIDSDDPTIDAHNNVDRFGDMMHGAPQTFRAGFAVSRTEGFNRIVTWHKTTAFGSGAIGSGHLFKSYNMPSDTGTSNIFSHPFRPTTNLPATLAPSPFDFDFGDSDNIYTLPNGLFGFYTTVPPTGQVANVATAGEAFPGPTRCFQCHDNQTNLIPFVDQLHSAILAAPPGTYPSTLQPLLLGMYDQYSMDVQMGNAGNTFGAAYTKLQLPALDIAGPNTGFATEVMNVVANNYSIVLQVDTAAAEIGVPPAQLVAAILASPTVAQHVPELLTFDANHQPNGIVRRDAWEANYPLVRRLLFPQL